MQILAPDEARTPARQSVGTRRLLSAGVKSPPL
jgi:hypothetical protein